MLQKSYSLGENLEWVESDSVDFINFAYVLHEMPEKNAKTMVREMFRVLKPGGVINGFEVPYQRNPIAREFYVSMNTWNEDWQVQVCTSIFLLISTTLKSRSGFSKSLANSGKIQTKQILTNFSVK